jgi:hypothetical protein
MFFKSVLFALLMVMITVSFSGCIDWLLNALTTIGKVIAGVTEVAEGVKQVVETVAPSEDPASITTTIPPEVEEIADPLQGNGQGAIARNNSQGQGQGQNLSENGDQVFEKGDNLDDNTLTVENKLIEGFKSQYDSLKDTIDNPATTEEDRLEAQIEIIKIKNGLEMVLKSADFANQTLEKVKETIGEVDAFLLNFTSSKNKQAPQGDKKIPEDDFTQ